MESRYAMDIGAELKFIYYHIFQLRIDIAHFDPTRKSMEKTNKMNPLSRARSQPIQ